MSHRRSALVVLLAACFTLAAGLLVWLQLERGPRDEALPQVALRGADGPRAPVNLPRLPAARDSAPGAVGGVPAPLTPPPAARLGPSQVLARVVDHEDGRPVPDFSFVVLPHGPEATLLARVAEHPEAPVPVRRSTTGILRSDRPAGLWDVAVFAPGFLPGSAHGLELPVERAQAHEIRLKRGLSIAGFVYDGNGLGVRDVPVFLGVVAVHGDEQAPRTTVAHTDAAGRFRFSPLPAGEYEVALLEPDNPVDRRGGLRLEQGTLNVDLFLAPRHQIVVTVNDAAGSPIEDALVELLGAGAGDARTNAAGQARLRFVRDGDYRLRVRAPGYAEHEEPCLVAGFSGERLLWATLTPLVEH